MIKKISARYELGAKAILRNDDVSTYSETRDTISGNYFGDTLANSCQIKSCCLADNEECGLCKASKNFKSVTKSNKSIF